MNIKPQRKRYDINSEAFFQCNPAMIYYSCACDVLWYDKILVIIRFRIYHAEHTNWKVVWICVIKYEVGGTRYAIICTYCFTYIHASIYACLYAPVGVWLPPFYFRLSIAACGLWGGRHHPPPYSAELIEIATLPGKTQGPHHPWLCCSAAVFYKHVLYTVPERVPLGLHRE